MKILLRHGVRHFKDQYGGQSLCFLRIYRDSRNHLLHTVLFTEFAPDEIEGMLKQLLPEADWRDISCGTVMGAVEAITTEIVKQYGLVPEFTTVLIQDGRREDTRHFFDRIRLFWDGRKFRRGEMSAETIRELSELATFLPEEFFKQEARA